KATSRQCIHHYITAFCKAESRNIKRLYYMSDESVKVLLIEDDVRVRELYELVLKMDEYQVITAETGEDGIEKAKSEQPDLIFLDIRLPGMNGLEVLEILRQDEQTSAIPVVILSNLDDEKTVS